MDLKDLEKMLKVIESLDPEQSGQDNGFKLNDSNIELKSELKTYPLFHNSRKASLPMLPLTPHINKGINDTQKSLFENTKSQSSTSINRSSWHHPNSKHSQKHSPENITFKMDPSISSDADKYGIYEDVASANLVQKINTNVVEIDYNIDNFEIDTISIQPLFLNDSLNKKNMKLLKKQEMRHSYLLEQACHNRSIKDNESLFNTLQSQPSPLLSPMIDSTIDVSLHNPNYLDSGLNKIIFVNPELKEAVKSTRWISDKPEENMNFFSNDVQQVTYTLRNSSTKSPEISDLPEKDERTLHQKIIHNVKTVEEQNEFFRLISNELSNSGCEKKEIIKFYMRNGSFSSQIINESQTASSACELLKIKFKLAEDALYQIVEVITKESLERPLEDHENVLAVFYSWKNESYSNQFIFEWNLAKYIIFMEPGIFRNEMKSDFQITDPFWVKVTQSNWFRGICSIKDCNVFYTTKPSPKERNNKDLNLLVNLSKVNVYSCSDNKRIKKEYKSPTMDLIIFKEDKTNHKTQTNIYLAPLNNLQKERWLEALKVAKYSFTQLKKNYLENKTCFPTALRGKVKSEVEDDPTLYPMEPYSI